MTIPTKHASSIAQAFIAELDVEMPPTRRLLERVPGEKAAWKPHPKSFSLGNLAQLVARMPGWVTHTRSEEHTSELQSLTNIVCRLLLEKKKNKKRPSKTVSSKKKKDNCTTMG